MFGNFLGDASIDVLFNMSSIINNGGFENNYLLTDIADGLNNRVNFIYNKGIFPNPTLSRPTSTYPNIYAAISMPVVTVATLTTGSTTLSSVNYSYANPLINLKGKGVIGIVNSNSVNNLTGIKEVSTQGIYALKAFTYPSSSHQYDGTGGELLIKYLTLTPKVLSWGGYTISNSQVIKKDLLKSTSDTITTTFDDFNNALSVEIRSNGQGIETTTNEITSTGSWCPSKISSQVIIKKKRGSIGNFSKTSTWKYNSLGLLSRETIYSDKPDSLSTTYVYNSYGNIVKKRVFHGTTSSAPEEYIYDVKNRLPVTISRNNLSVSRDYDFSNNNLLTETDPGGIVVTNEYNNDGNLAKTFKSANEYIEYSYTWNNSDPVKAITLFQSKVNGGNTSKIWYDGAGRVIKKSVKGFDGTEVFNDKVYNQSGKIKKTSQPYLYGGTPTWNTVAYDTIGRVSSINQNGSNVTYNYNGLIITGTSISGSPRAGLILRTKSIAYNGLGQIISTTQNGSTMSFAYNDNGSVQTITPPGNGTQLTYSYDSRGFPEENTDPDRGTTQQNINSLGQSTSYTDAAGNLSASKYDCIGRDSLWTRQEGNTYFVYKDTIGSKGKISAITAVNDTRNYYYDIKGRVIKMSDSFNDGNKFTYKYEYDSYGRLSKLVYPTGLFVTYSYNAQGYLSEITDGLSGTMLWHRSTMDKWGNTTNYTMANSVISVSRVFDSNDFISSIKTMVGTNVIQWFSYTFDPVFGDLKSRGDMKRSLTENFGYDLNDRLLYAKGTGVDTLKMTYNDIGNIISKSDVGGYSYDNQKVHAVNNITRTGSASLFGTQRIIYNSMNLPVKIASTTDSLAYTYGIGTTRIKAAQYTNGQLTKTTWYGMDYEKVVSGSSEKNYHWIQSPDGPVALIVKNGTSYTYYYLLRDHLNSITGVMNSSGVLLEEYSYDAWGRRRSPSTWSTSSYTAPTITNRGFTGHEHLDAFGLIHMNGRIYDPHLARILNPDPVIQDPMNIQNYNRYSYCLNNPLKYIDPSGYEYENDPIGAMNYLWNSDYGGTWSRGHAPAPFQTRQELSAAVATLRSLVTGGHGGIGGSGGIKGSIAYGTNVTIDFVYTLPNGGIIVNFTIGSGNDGCFAYDGSTKLDYTRYFFETDNQQVNLGLVVNNIGNSLGHAIRPDEDGKLTLSEANEWYRTGNGEPLTVKLSQINLKSITPDDFPKGEGSTESFNLLFRLNAKSGLVYGNITLKLGKNNTVTALPDVYDFNRQDVTWTNFFKTIPRNTETRIGNWVAGEGTPYSINFEGTGNLGKPFSMTEYYCHTGGY